MKTPAFWTLAVCAALLPPGRAAAKPRADTGRGQHERTQAEQGGRNRGVLVERAQRMTTKGSTSMARRASKPAFKPPCFSPAVHVTRRRGDVVEHRNLALTFCDTSPNPAALDSLSVLARPRDVERPLMPEIRAYRRRPADRGPSAGRRLPDHLSEHVVRVHPDLLGRLQKVAEHFPGKAIEVISGHRPDARDTSRHHDGRALDLRVDGVSREALRDFLRRIDATGVGYYPNSYFVHMDVRDKRGYWVDRSGPGEAADYGTKPPTRREIDRERDSIVASAIRDLSALGDAITVPEAADPALGDAEEHDEPAEDTLTREQIGQIRAEALGAVEAL